MRKLLLLVALIISGTTVFAQSVAELVEKAQTALVDKNYAESLKYYDQAFANPGESEIPAGHYYNAAIAADKSSQFESAIKYYDLAIAANTKVEQSKAGKSDALVSLGKYEEALAVDPASAGKVSFKIAGGAYKTKDYETAATYFAKATEAGYQAEKAVYYQYLSLAKSGKADQGMELLKANAEAYPNSNITKTLANSLVKQGNGLYKEGAAILSSANEKINAGTFTTEDAEYATAVANSKAKFKEALEVLTQAQTYDATNANAKALIDACNSALK